MVCAYAIARGSAPAPSGPKNNWAWLIRRSLTDRMSLFLSADWPMISLKNKADWIK